jgi:hypothetical protein
MMHRVGLLLLVLVLCTAVLKADPVCNVCMCFETTVNCTARNLQRHFNDSDWPSDMVITDVMIDNNQLVHVTQYPPLAVLRLSLSHNNIVRIDNETFVHLQNLTELDLSHNLITSENLDSDVFKVKQPIQNKFLCLNSACPFLVLYEEYITKSLSVNL